MLKLAFELRKYRPELNWMLLVLASRMILVTISVVKLRVCLDKLFFF